ncbi:NIC-domain-containing protein, partial [Linderina pennispora]
SLNNLLEESKRLNAHLASSEIPTVQRGIGLLESESRKLVARSVRHGRTLDPRAQSLLASSGVDTDELMESSASAALLNAFELLQPKYDANVESFLAQQQEQSIISAIEESELSTLDDLDRHMVSHMQSVWEDTQKRLFEELGQYQGIDPHSMLDGAQGSSVFDLGGVDKVVQPRVARYAEVIKSLNNARVASKPFDLVAGLEKASSESFQELRSKQVGQTWSLLASYAAGNPSDVASAACKYLEKTFVEHIDNVIAQYPREANVGGVPSVHRRIEGYLKIHFARNYAPEFLEAFENQAIWAHMYMLYRCGYAEELLKYAVDLEDVIVDSDPGFVAHLKAFIKGAAQVRSSIATTNTSLQDPYKAALYRVIGRGNVPKKATIEVTQTTEDYMWAHLAMVRDSAKLADAGQPRSTLESLQELVLKFGPSHFDSNGANPLLYFRVLLLCGLFAHAIDYLARVDQYQVEAVHTAIALANMGRLSVPGGDSAGTFTNFLVDEGGQTSLDFTKLVVHYARALPPTMTDDAAQYLLLLTLPGLGKAEPARGRQIRLCQQALIHALYENRQYARYLGDISADGKHLPGYLEKYLVLMGLRTSDQFSQTIVNKLADHSRDEGRLTDTVMLYNLAKRHSSVLNVLSKQLGEVLFMRSNGRKNEADALADVEGVARTVLQYYRQHDNIARDLDTNAVSTCNTLLEIIDFLRAHERGAYEQALEFVAHTGLLPLSGDITEATQHADRIRTLDDSITKNFSLILLAAMDTLLNLYLGLKESAFLDTVKQSNMLILRQKARGLMVFAGMIQFRMPSDTYAKLNRMDVFMN